MDQNDPIQSAIAQAEAALKGANAALGKTPTKKQVFHTHIDATGSIVSPAEDTPDHVHMTVDGEHTGPPAAQPAVHGNHGR
jgi:hypothetical protein